MSTGSRPRALAVSRDRMIVGVTFKLLDSLGYEAEGALAGTDAVRRLREAHFDAVVATFGAPPMTGYGLWALMQGMPRLAEVPFVLALTPDEQKRLSMEGREMPATVQIPFTLDGLAAAIERAKKGEVAEIFEI